MLKELLRQHAENGLPRRVHVIRGLAGCELRDHVGLDEMPAIRGEGELPVEGGATDRQVITVDQRGMLTLPKEAHAKLGVARGGHLVVQVSEGG